MVRRSAPVSPSVRRRRLASELRKLREALGLANGSVAKSLSWQPSKLSRIERGEQGIKPGDLNLLLDQYEVTDREYREALTQLSRDATKRGWWTDFRDIVGVLPDLEAGAEVLRTFQVQAIPGLLETPDYIEAVFRGGAAHTQKVVDRHVEARIARQQILNGVHPARLKAVIDEGALRRMVGGHEVMREQLQHLINMATRHNVDINILPFAAGAHAAMLGGFTILEFPDPRDSSVAFVESVTSSLVLEEPHHLSRCNDVFGHLQSASMPADQSLAFIEMVMDEIPT